MDREQRITELAQLICVTGNVEGFTCVCPHLVDGWCLGGRLRQQAEAVLSYVENRDGEQS